MSKSTNRRKSIAIALAVLGVAGLSLASASQLNLTSTPQLQAGVKDVTNCQTSDISVVFTTPVLAGGEYKSASLALSPFDALCTTNNAKYKVALLGSNGAALQEVGGNVATGSLQVPLAGATPATISRVIVTIYS